RDRARAFAAKIERHLHGDRRSGSEALADRFDGFRREQVIAPGGRLLVRQRDEMRLLPRRTGRPARECDEAIDAGVSGEAARDVVDRSRVDELLARAIFDGDGEHAARQRIEILADDRLDDALEGELVGAIVGDDDRESRLVTMKLEVVEEAIEQHWLFDRQRQLLPPGCAEAVGIVAAAIEDVRLEHALPEEESAAVFAKSEAEDRADAGGDGEDRLAESPAAAIVVAFLRAPDVAPEIVEVVARLAVAAQLRIDGGIAGESARPEVFDEEIRHRLIGTRGTALKVLAQSAEVLLGRIGVQSLRAGAKTEADANRSARAARIERVLNRLSNQRVGEILHLEELVVHRIDVHLALIHRTGTWEGV